MEEVRSSVGEYSYTIRKTPVLLVMRILMVEVLIMITHYLLRVLMGFVASQLQLELSVTLLTIEVIALQAVNVVLLLAGVMGWLGEYYILNPKELVVRRGILSTQSTTYEFANLQSMSVVQNIWGKLFNYGTIRLYNPVLKEEVFMSYVPSPTKYGSIIQQHNPDITPLIRKRS